MGPERGMTVAELIEYLQTLSPMRDVLLEVKGEQEPLTKENIQEYTGNALIITPVLIKASQDIEDTPRETESGRCTHHGRCMHYDEASA